MASASSAPASPEDHGDFTADESKTLLEDGIFTSPIQSGKRTVSAAFSPPTSISSGSSGSTASVRTLQFNTATNAPFPLSMSAESVAALEFIGFTTQAAEHIFRRYESRPDPSVNPDSLIRYVHGHIARLRSPDASDMDDVSALNHIGINAKLRDAITDARFTTLLLSQTLHFWVKDSVDTNYSTLLSWLSGLKEHAVRSRAKKKKQKRTSVQGAFEAPVAATTTAAPDRSATVNIVTRRHQLPEAHIIVTTEEAELLEDHIMLYKGKAVAELGDAPFIRDDGTVEMATLATRGGGDFNHVNSVSYWTPDKDVAEQYRKYAAHRCDWSETWLISIQVKKTFIESLRKAELWYSPDWKRYIWHCKKSREPPERFDRLWRVESGTDYVVGHICGGHGLRVTKINDASDVLEKVTDDFVMRCPDNERKKAIQWVFMQQRSIQRLGEEIKGKIQIHVVAPEVQQGA